MSLSKGMSGAEKFKPATPLPPTDDIAMLRIDQVRALVGLSRATIYAKVKDGSFPRPIKLSLNAVAWQRVAVKAWIEERVQESQQQPAD